MHSLDAGKTRNIVSITRTTIHNGPGIRTLILFKGCPLHCLWCSTPESQKDFPELAIFQAKCIQCDQCLPVCPKNAIRMADKTLIVDRNECNSCGRCVEVCSAEALRIIGRPMTVEALVEEAKKDEVFFRKSNGGVTISGGEPLLDLEFNLKLLPRFKEEGISVGVDTCGYVPRDHIEPLLPDIDFFLWDIKHMDPAAHQKLTGVSNRQILNNARSIAARGIPLYIRVPVIPGCNDSIENLRETCEFSKSLASVVEIDLLPLHHLGKARYLSLDREYAIDGLELIPENVLQNLKKLVESYGLRCFVIN